MAMEHVFDDLIGLQRTRPRWYWRANAAALAIRLALAALMLSSRVSLR
ncbi:hypothetical protein JQK88_12005 [Mesorhizobium caraganae]|nr:hypothetical protein [Mesorhizobium caraganae]MBM2711966.1 hypothetical protein [Mesorhizobium caraganae]